MIIKQKNGVKAYKVLQKLNAQETSGSLALKIFKAMNVFQLIWDFQIQEEKKIMEKYPDFDPMTGSINVEAKGGNKEEAINEIKKIDQELTDLANLDTDIDFEPFIISLDGESIKLSGQDIKDLTGFVTFE